MTSLPWWPAGRAVDLVRSCYTTRMRIYHDSDETFIARWYFVDDNTPFVPFYHRYASGNWNLGEKPWSGPGEVLGAKRDWVDGSAPPWFGGNLGLPGGDNASVAGNGAVKGDRLYPVPVWCQFDEDAEADDLTVFSEVAVATATTIFRQGPLYPVTNGQFPNIVPGTWINVDLAREPDGLTANCSTGTLTRYIIAGDYGFTIPDDATITGVQASVRKVKSSGAAIVVDETIQLYLAFDPYGENRAQVTTWPVSLDWTYYGGPLDTMGVSTDPATVNDGNFQLALRAQRNTGIAGVDAMGLTVFYSLPED